MTQPDAAELLMRAVRGALDIDNDTRALRARYGRLTPVSGRFCRWWSAAC
jgi:hypothetical protein